MAQRGSAKQRRAMHDALKRRARDAANAAILGHADKLLQQGKDFLGKQGSSIKVEYNRNFNAYSKAGSEMDRRQQILNRGFEAVGGNVDQSEVEALINKTKKQVLQEQANQLPDVPKHSPGTKQVNLQQKPTLSDLEAFSKLPPVPTHQPGTRAPTTPSFKDGLDNYREQLRREILKKGKGMTKEPIEKNLENTNLDNPSELNQSEAPPPPAPQKPEKKGFFASIAERTINFFKGIMGISTDSKAQESNQQLRGISQQQAQSSAQPEEAIIKINKQLKKIHKRHDELTTSIESLHFKAKDSLQKGDREKARAFLRQKKQMKNFLQRNDLSKNNLKKLKSNILSGGKVTTQKRDNFTPPSTPISSQKRSSNNISR